MKLRIKDGNVEKFNAPTSRGVYYDFKKGQVLEVPDEDAKDLLNRYSKILEEVKPRKDTTSKETKEKKDTKKKKK